MSNTLAKAIKKEGKFGAFYTVLYHDMSASVNASKIQNPEAKDITEILDHTTFQTLKWQKIENKHYVTVDPQDNPPWPSHDKVPEMVKSREIPDSQEDQIIALLTAILVELKTIKGGK